ncbi:MAG: glycosyltransferase family 39 protein, partial [Bdellovibrionales bacterium]|nr:glycosyltransferase family 39 protein [Bdellovibrionales bacterium]
MFVLSLAWVCGFLSLTNSWTLPPDVSDGHEYDNIALNLARGRGFGLAYGDAEYRAPYEALPDGFGHSWLLDKDGDFSPTSFRPPLFPIILSFTYGEAPRNFALWRFIQALIIAATITLSVRLAAEAGGVPAAAASMLLWFFDFTLLDYSYRFMTEPLAALGIAATIWVAWNYLDQPRLRFVVGMGIIIGLLILLRSVFILWVPLVSLLFLAPTLRHLRLSLRARHLALFVATSVLVPSPWFLRNVLLIGPSMPLGTQGGMILGTGYS